MTARARIGRSQKQVVLVAGIVLALVVLALVFRSPAVNSVRASLSLAGLRPHRADILFAARESKLDPYLLAAMVRAESSGRVGVVSDKGALGLLQLMHATAVERAQVLGLPDPTPEALLSDARLNLRLGANYLAHLIAWQEHDLERALVAYNAGPTRLARWIEEKGSYAAWRSERRAARNSDVLAFADRVKRFRDELAASRFLEE